MAGVWKVVHKPRVAVRKEPSTSGQILGSQPCGTELQALEARGAWLRIGGETAGWILSDGSALGLGALLERLDTKPMTLHLRHPLSGAALPDLTLPGDAPVSQARQELATAAGLQAKHLLPCAPRTGLAAPLSKEDIPLWEAGFREGDELLVVYTGQGERSLPPGAEEAISRLQLGKGGGEDVKKAVAQGFEAEALRALLAALAAGRRAGPLLFRWAFSPRLGQVGSGGPPAAPFVLLLGWGGSVVEMLQGPQRFWEEQGYFTIATTRSPLDLDDQVKRVADMLKDDAQVLVHSFSNNGLYFLADLLQSWRGKVCGVVVDSAPDPGLKPSLLRQVANGSIRALCVQHKVELANEEDQALASLELITKVQEGDVLEPKEGGLAVVSPDGTCRGMAMLTASDGTCLRELDLVGKLGEALTGRPLTARDVEELSCKISVAEVDLPDFSSILDQCKAGDDADPCPVLFVYSRSDTLIKASIVEAFAKTIKGKVQLCCLQASGHVRHWERHRDAYAAELRAFAASIGF